MKGESAIAILVGICSLAVAGYSHYKTELALKKMGVSFDTLSQKTSYEVSPDVVQAAVKKKVDEIVTEEVSRASKTAVELVREDMSSYIREKVNEELLKASAGLSKEIKKAFLEEAKEIARKEAESNVKSSPLDGLSSFDKLQAIRAICNTVDNAVKPKGSIF